MPDSNPAHDNSRLVDRIGGKLKKVRTKKGIELAVLIGLIVMLLVGGVVLFLPVNIDPNGDYNFNLFPHTAKQEITDSKGEKTTKQCGQDGCNTNYKEFLADDKYQVETTVYNIMGIEVSKKKEEIVVDSVPPILETTIPAVTNKEETKLSIQTEAGANLTINGQQTAVDAEGKAEYTLAINKEAVTSVTIVATDAAGNSTTKSAEVWFDDKIELVITSPADGATVDSQFTVTGKTEAGATVTAQGVTATANENGEFSLNLGYQNESITVTATDAAGNTAASNLNVKKKVVAAAPAIKTYKDADMQFDYYDSMGTASWSDEAGAVLFSNSPVAARGYGGAIWDGYDVTLISTQNIAQPQGLRTVLEVWKVNSTNGEFPALDGYYAIIGDVFNSAGNDIMHVVTTTFAKVSESQVATYKYYITKILATSHLTRL